MSRDFLWGALAATSAVAGLFFLRFWRTTQDRFFLLFALAFGVFSLHWTALAVVDVPDETRPYLYLPRLLAFLLILGAIAEKNRRR